MASTRPRIRTCPSPEAPLHPGLDICRKVAVSSEKKLARNEALFREVNENIEKAAIEHRYQATELPVFVCECSDAECGDLIRLSITQYEDVRRHGDRFFIFPGHEVAEIERVVDSYEGYVVVQKVGPGRDTAEDRDPRGV